MHTGTIMTIELPDDIIKAAGLTEEDCRIELGVRLYADRRISLAQALRLSGLNRSEFERQLADRDISLYTVDDLRDDVETLKTLYPLKAGQWDVGHVHRGAEFRQEFSHLSGHRPIWDFGIKPADFQGSV
jgi:predicted HTH domain antitoxin